VGVRDFLIAAGMLIFMDVMHRLFRGQDIDAYFRQIPWWARLGFYVLLINLILYLRVPEQQAFIYFEF